MIVLESDRVKSQIVHPDVQLRAQRQSSVFLECIFPLSTILSPGGEKFRYDVIVDTKDLPVALNLKQILSQQCSETKEAPLSGAYVLRQCFSMIEVLDKP